MTKPRVQVDAFVIGSFMVVTSILIVMFPSLYVENELTRNICAVIGFVCIVFGALFRMSARGYKKAVSQQSSALVTGGPYKLVRNPMYLGTFLVGVGFMFPLFPLWTIAIFAAVFYLRFVLEIRKEQKFLSNAFGVQYEEYCRNVPAFIPNLKSIRSVTFNEVFSKKYLWTTKEKYGLFYWPVINGIFWYLQQEMFWKGMTFIPVIINSIIALVFLTWMILSVAEEE
jgi:protein-S-isoprenylcysteine O-methyltransferase Ste14